MVGKREMLMASVEADKFIMVFLVLWLEVEELMVYRSLADMTFCFDDGFIVGRLENCLITLADLVRHSLLAAEAFGNSH